MNGTEYDPSGRDASTPGAKLDAGKVRAALVLGGFARALWEVCRVGTYGATKYSDNGWMEVPDGINRYDDAGMRHWLKEKMGQTHDPDTNLQHAAHEAWNALARLDRLIREKEKANVNILQPERGPNPQWNPEALYKIRGCHPIPSGSGERIPSASF